MAAILLSTLNARYFHASLGLRYLLANMEELRTDTQLLEFIITQPPIDIVASLLERQPKIIGFGVYIWNVEETTKVVALLKKIRPDIMIVLGGPEVSYESAEQTIVQLADYVITGPADISFLKFCRRILANDPPKMKIIIAETVPLTQLRLPYHEYTIEDIAHRLIYVEASRGCPFKCEFCLSSLDKTAKPFDLDLFLRQMQDLYDRGARQFKFVDRTFNLNINTGIRILEFFLERLDERLFLHFELIPDHLPDRLKAIIARFPPGSLQFEIGIQSFNPTVQALISRRQDNRKTEENLIWLRQHSQAHLHADLIVGLPGEDIESFGAGFNRLVALNPHEIQVGILKRLRGTPIARHTADFGIKYNPYPPYNILCSNTIDFATLRQLEHFARYWDMIANSGRFHNTKPILLEDNPFERFLRFSDWLFATTRQTHQIALERLFDLVYRGLIHALAVEQGRAIAVVTQDYQASGAKAIRLLCGRTVWEILPKIGRQDYPSLPDKPGISRKPNQLNPMITQKKFYSYILLLLAALLISGIGPYDRLTWFMETAPVMIAVPVMIFTYRRFPLTGLAYTLIFIHCVILMIGGHYTYAKTPIGFWLQNLFDLARNSYDRIGHFAQGFVPAILAREILIRVSRISRGKMLNFLVLCVCLAISAFYEFIEWWAALLLGQDAEQFLATQGDIWDTQWDMFMALVGAIAALVTLSKWHDRQLDELAARHL